MHATSVESGTRTADQFAAVSQLVVAPINVFVHGGGVAVNACDSATGGDDALDALEAPDVLAVAAPAALAVGGAGAAGGVTVAGDAIVVSRSASRGCVAA
jgi:hypothetical protein